MGTASFAGWVFRIDPTSVQWDFKVRTNTTYTLGGKVVQILGTELGPLRVSGEFGKGYFPEQQRFLDAMIDVGDDQVRNFASDPPPRFIYPDYGWDFLAYLVSYTGDGEKAVTLDPAIINPKWTLTLHIMEDNSGLQQAATDRFISRLAAGIGWHINEYNGPRDWENVREFLETSGVADIPSLLQMAYGAGGGGAPVSSAPGDPQQAAGVMSAAEIAYVAQQAGFSGENLVIAVAVAFAESSGNPNSDGPDIPMDGTLGMPLGLWQIRLDTNDRGTGQGRDEMRLKDPYFNAIAAYDISSHGVNWQPWEAYTNGNYQQYMDEARAGAAHPTPPATTSPGAQGGQPTAGGGN